MRAFHVSGVSLATKGISFFFLSVSWFINAASIVYQFHIDSRLIFRSQQVPIGFPGMDLHWGVMGAIWSQYNHPITDPPPGGAGRAESQPCITVGCPVIRKEGCLVPAGPCRGCLAGESPAVTKSGRGSISTVLGQSWCLQPQSAFCASVPLHPNGMEARMQIEPNPYPTLRKCPNGDSPWVLDLEGQPP